MTFKNNIFDISSYDRVALWYGYKDQHQYLKTFAQFNALNGASPSYNTITGNLATNSLLQSDYKIPSNSPAIDAGISLGLTTDFFGNSVPYNSTPDIGVYEYSGSNLPPIPKMKKRIK
jgi:hypothetical protein